MDALECTKHASHTLAPASSYYFISTQHILWHLATGNDNIIITYKYISIRMHVRVCVCAASVRT